MKVLGALLFASICFAQPNAHSIRRTDLASAMQDLFAATYDDSCDDTGRSATPVIAQKQFGDLDGDGSEEVAVSAYSCFSGTGGADLFTVLKLTSNGRLARVPLEIDFTRPLPLIKGRNVGIGIRGHMSISIRSAVSQLPELRVVFPLYKDADANCCPSAGFREFIFRWDGKRLALRTVHDLPAATGS